MDFEEMWMGTPADPIAAVWPLSPGGMLKNAASSPSPSSTVCAFQLPASMNAPFPRANSVTISSSLRAS